MLAWTAAGIIGYVPNTASMDDLLTLIEQITQGEAILLARASPAACCAGCAPASRPSRRQRLRR